MERRTRSLIALPPLDILLPYTRICPQVGIACGGHTRRQALHLLAAGEDLIDSFVDAGFVLGAVLSCHGVHTIFGEGIREGEVDGYPFFCGEVEGGEEVCFVPHGDVEWRRQSMAMVVDCVVWY